MAPVIETVVLEGRAVRLEPLDRGHIEGLAAAAAEDRSTYRYTWVPDGLEGTATYVTEALALHAAGEQLPFAIRSKLTGEVLGATRFLDIACWDAPGRPTAVEVGGTWLAASVQRTSVNTESKLLLLTHAFEHWGTVRVSIKTDARNGRSRAAIERIGGRFEGVRRAHMKAADGGVRDTAWFSITAEEWPAVRAGLELRLSATPAA
jgi:RimJ/RimL family protein N-acetyltransferase